MRYGCGYALPARRTRFLAANVGDVVIVIGTAEGVKTLTIEHKPCRIQERARIEAAGGKILLMDIPRVQGGASYESSSWR